MFYVLSLFSYCLYYWSDLIWRRQNFPLSLQPNQKCVSVFCIVILFKYLNIIHTLDSLQSEGRNLSNASSWSYHHWLSSTLRCLTDVGALSDSDSENISRIIFIRWWSIHVQTCIIACLSFSCWPLFLLSLHDKWGHYYYVTGYCLTWRGCRLSWLGACCLSWARLTGLASCGQSVSVCPRAASTAPCACWAGSTSPGCSRQSACWSSSPPSLSWCQVTVKF